MPVLPQIAPMILLCLSLYSLYFFSSLPEKSFSQVREKLFSNVITFIQIKDKIGEYLIFPSIFTPYFSLLTKVRNSSLM
jgi:hypothetical protein